VDDALFVGVFERVGHLASNLQNVLDRNWALVDAIGQRGTLNQLHHKSTSAVGGFESIDQSDVGMVEGSEDLGFASEPRHALSIAAKGVGKNLDGYISPKFWIAGTVDFAHATHTNS